ncbi:c-type cytochrome biogenesis protein CcmI [Alteromonas ponticola]|uniref:C-type cytochrome biogenesis protein CcmI n=1 Tax=Alteromonas aquimaris TaxID=2998417 RepID=A0ABT3P2H4_9ALTE|nr:c-type cytochrome biogenesis protein CcmI [Alteromonas aquimaris]MCW8106964.1 c-type cytochrome biogenesis protein CcmI [Alteromonas aquimaris]
MSWLTFITASVMLVALLIFIISLPWWRKKTAEVTESVNTKIVKQRLAEIQAEVEQGLISKEDSEQAVKELKIALVDETRKSQSSSSHTSFILSAGALIAVLIGGGAYFSANQLTQVSMASEAINALPALSEKLADGSASDFTAQDLTALTLAIRQRLRVDPADVQGWLYLGRLWMAAGQQKQAIDALEKARLVSPDNIMVNVTYAQLLTATDEPELLRKAQGILHQLIKQFPENDNFSLLMSVASAQLGDMEKARHYFAKIKDKLSPDSNIYQELVTRIEGSDLSQMQAIDKGENSLTGFDLTISIAKGYENKIPNTGYLIVFAQDANSDNKMPAAVIKLPLTSFPRQLKLTNDNAMMAEYSLSQLQTVKLTARLSKDEDVMPQIGELEGHIITEVVEGTVVNQSIIIDKELQ